MMMMMISRRHKYSVRKIQRIRAPAYGTTRSNHCGAIFRRSYLEIAQATRHRMVKSLRKLKWGQNREKVVEAYLRQQSAPHL